MVVNTKGTSMNMKTGKKMKGGFMCMSRSMALPPIQRSNYIRLGDQRRRRSFPLPSDQHKLPPSIQPTIPPHNLFQVHLLYRTIIFGFQFLFNLFLRFNFMFGDMHVGGCHESLHPLPRLRQ